MRSEFLFFVTAFFLPSCVQQLNQNLQQSNDLMQQNMEALTQSRVAIEANTHEIHRSTEAMHSFQYVVPVLFGVILILSILE